MKKLSYPVGLMLFCCVCFSTIAQQNLRVKKSRYSVTQEYDSRLNPKTVALIAGYQQKMDKEMSQTIGFAPSGMVGGLPESPLLNLTADALRSAGAVLTGDSVDIAFMNNGGLRSTLSKGNITTGNIFEIYPFDNALVVLTIKGSDLKPAFAYLAQNGGGGVSNVSLQIADGQVKSLTIGGKPLDESRMYKVATIDYLADGNDGFESLKNAIDRKYSGQKLRDVMLQYIKDLTAKGLPVEAREDGRVKVEQKSGN